METRSDHRTGSVPLASRLRYPIALGLVGLLHLLVLPNSGDLWPLVVWSGASFLIAAAAYGPLGPRAFGKRPDGSMSPLPVAAALPFLLLTWGVWRLQRRLTTEPCCHEIAPGLWLGRRPLPGEVPAGAGLILDMTAEFPALQSAIGGRAYRCIPTVDGAVPGSTGFSEALQEAASRPGGVYVHCALGHGRSAMMVAAILTARGLAPDPDAALQLVCSRRPAVELSPLQHAFLRDQLSQHPSSAPTAPRQEGG